MRPDENSRKPKQTKQSIFEDTHAGRDIHIKGNVTQTTTINNSSNANTPSLRAFQAPATPEYYVDRPEVSLDLKQRLLADARTLVISAIHGLGSVGKSTLAAALAHDADIQKHFCDGILWATLGQEPDVLSLLGAWVEGLGDNNYRATSIEATSAHLNTLLFDKAVLLVVDDAWIDEILGWEPVQAFKVGGDRTRMLVTTRDASIANFLGASTFSLDVMTRTQALELLTKKIETQGKQLQQEEIKSAKALAEAVGYLPLALELAAAQVASGTSWQVLIKDIKQEIARLKSFQDPGIRNISNDEKFKKLSLQASLNLSIKRLEENDREYFAWLGVLPEDASITPKMTVTLWDMDERDAEETLQYLRSQALLLLGVFLADGTATYRLHDLFHDLARNLLTLPEKPKRQGDLIGLGMKWKDVHAQLLDKYQLQTENNSWHTLPDDGYIHQHLVWHLEKAGKVEEIHQLLREESASGNNGWYEVRERFGQTAGFLTDVAKAWELAELDWEKENLSQAVSLQCRYALIIASLNSLAANIPTQLIVAFVKNKLWYPEQGLAYALQKQDAQDKASSLIALADYLPQALKYQGFQTILKIVCQIQNEYNRAYVLSSLTEKLPENLYREVLEIVCQIQDEYNRTYVLLSLTEKLPENLYREVLEIVCQIQDEYNRARILSSLAARLPETLYNEMFERACQIQDKYYRASVLYFFAENLPDNLYNKMLERADQIQCENYQADSLFFFAKKLQVEKLYSEVLEIARRIQDKDYRADILFSLTEELKSENLYSEILEAAYQIQYEDYHASVILSLAEKLQSKNLYKEALETARQIQDENYRANILSSLTKKLPENLYKEALETARQIQDKNYCPTVILSLAEKLQSENLYEEALETARQIQDENYRTKFLLSLAKKLQSKKFYKEVLEIARQIQDENYRANVLSSLAAKLPENLYKEALEAARQIQDENYLTKFLLSLAKKLAENFYKEV
ncbi:MAG: NB-ARC domain-containing protein, partial [Rivularia sp. (in: cyanobacteria)]